MHLIFYFLVGIWVAGCARPQPGEQNLPQVFELMREIRGNETTLSEAQVLVCEVLAHLGRWNEAEALANSIRNYRLGLAKACTLEVAVRQGKFELARKKLFEMGNVPLAGVGLQRDEILARLLAVARACEGVEGALEAFRKQGVSIPPFLQRAAKDGLAYSLANGEGEKGEGAMVETGQEVSTPGVKEASTRETVVGRMGRRGATDSILLRGEGLRSLGRMEDLKELLKPTLVVGLTQSAGNIGQRADLLDLAWSAGFQKEVESLLPQLLAETEEISGALDTAGGYRARVVRLLGRMGKLEPARKMLAKTEADILRDLRPFFQVSSLAQLGQGAWEGGFQSEAVRIWANGLGLAKEIDNPRSQAWGALMQVLAQTRCGQVLSQEDQARITALLASLPAQYRTIRL